MGTDSPEVLDNFVVLSITSVVGVLLPIFDIDIGNTTDKKL